MKLLAYLTESFIATFGITRPRPEQERMANMLIGGFLLFFGVIVLLIMGFLIYRISLTGHDERKTAANVILGRFPDRGHPVSME